MQRDASFQAGLRVPAAPLLSPLAERPGPTLDIDLQPEESSTSASSVSLHEVTVMGAAAEMLEPPISHGPPADSAATQTTPRSALARDAATHPSAAETSRGAANSHVPIADARSTPAISGAPAIAVQVHAVPHGPGAQEGRIKSVRQGSAQAERTDTGADAVRRQVSMEAVLAMIGLGTGKMH